MGVEEANILSGVQDFLELAVASGELEPGTKDWKRKQRKLVRTYLNNPNFMRNGPRSFRAAAASRRRFAQEDSGSTISPIALAYGATTTSSAKPRLKPSPGTPKAWYW